MSEKLISMCGNDFVRKINYWWPEVLQIEKWPNIL